MLLFYLRHGDPVYDPDSLTELGKDQAEALAKRLAAFGLDRIYSSTSRRALDTAAPTAKLTGLPVKALEFCHEVHTYREFGPRLEDGKRRWAFQIPRLVKLFCSKEVRDLQERWYDHPLLQSSFWPDQKFKEGTRRIQRETDAFLLSLGYEHHREEGYYLPVAPTEERIALFAHQGFGMAFLSAVLDVPYPQICSHFDMCHSGMTVIEFKESERIVIPKVLTLSNDSHLYREGLPLHYNKALRF